MESDKLHDLLSQQNVLIAQSLKNSGYRSPASSVDEMANQGNPPELDYSKTEKANQAASAQDVGDYATEGARQFPQQLQGTSSQLQEEGFPGIGIPGNLSETPTYAPGVRDVGPQLQEQNKMQDQQQVVLPGREPAAQFQDILDAMNREPAGKTAIGLERPPEPKSVPIPQTPKVKEPNQRMTPAEMSAQEAIAKQEATGILPQQSPGDIKALYTERAKTAALATGEQMKAYDPVVQHLNTMWKNVEDDRKQIIDHMDKMNAIAQTKPNDMVARNGFLGKLGFVAANLVGMGGIATALIKSDLNKQISDRNNGILNENNLIEQYTKLGMTDQQAYNKAENLLQNYAVLKHDSILQGGKASDAEIWNATFEKVKADELQQKDIEAKNIENKLKLATITGTSRQARAQQDIEIQKANTAQKTAHEKYTQPTSEDLKIIPLLHQMEDTGNEMSKLEQGLKGIDMSQYTTNAVVQSYIAGVKGAAGSSMRKAITDLAGKSGMVNIDKIAKYVNLAKLHANSWAQAQPKGRASPEQIMSMLPIIMPPTIGSNAGNVDAMNNRNNMIYNFKSGMSPGGYQQYLRSRKNK